VLLDHDPFHDSNENRRNIIGRKSAGCCCVVSFGIGLIRACFHWTGTVDDTTFDDENESQHMTCIVVKALGI